MILAPLSDYKAYSFIFVPEPNAQVIRDAVAGKLKLKDI